jgi:hypothetical protein
MGKEKISSQTREDIFMQMNPKETFINCVLRGRKVKKVEDCRVVKQKIKICFLIPSNEQISAKYHENCPVKIFRIKDNFQIFRLNFFNAPFTVEKRRKFI